MRGRLPTLPRFLDQAEKESNRVSHASTRFHHRDSIVVDSARENCLDFGKRESNSSTFRINPPIEATFFFRALRGKIAKFREKKNSFESSQTRELFFSRQRFFPLSWTKHERPKGRIESSKPTRSGYPRFVLLHALPRGGRKEKGVEGSSSGQQRRAGGWSGSNAGSCFDRDEEERNVTTTSREEEEEEGERYSEQKYSTSTFLATHRGIRSRNRERDSFSPPPPSSCFAFYIEIWSLDSPIRLQPPPTPPAAPSPGKDALQPPVALPCTRWALSSSTSASIIMLSKPTLFSEPRSSTPISPPVAR